MKSYIGKISFNIQKYSYRTCPLEGGGLFDFFGQYSIDNSKPMVGLLFVDYAVIAAA